MIWHHPIASIHPLIVDCLLAAGDFSSEANALHNSPDSATFGVKFQLEPFLPVL
jgi:hypothetical protein